MRKEVILAVIIGVILGGIILYGINLANTSSKTNGGNDKNEQNNQVSPSPTKSDNQISFITPLNNAVVTDAQVTLKGTAKPNSNVAIITESDDIISSVDAKGNFSSTINLISGENLIKVTTVDDKLATASASITVIRTATLPE